MKTKILFGTKEVYLDSFSLTLTYGGLLEGKPTKEETISSAQHWLFRIWGEGRKIHIIEPTIKDGWFPEYQLTAWLESPDSLIEDSCGSHAFIIWWAEDIGPLTIIEQIKTVCKNLSWDKVAEDYDV